MMGALLTSLSHALLMAFGMFWQVGWSLVLGFLISSVLQVFVSRDRVSALLGRDGVREVAVAMGLGAISSSCSYASASVSRTMFQKGAGLIASLAFLFASTNLVIELGLVLYLLLGWQFMVAEWVGGIVLVAMMSFLVKITYPHKLVEEARQKAAATVVAHDHSNIGARDKSFSKKMVMVAQNFVGDWTMLWKDLVVGFLIAGFLSTFVPNEVWQTLFALGQSPWRQVLLNAFIGPLIAIVSFVCSIGNVPMAAVLWGGGISFGGVLAFLYADLIVLPLLDVYRRYFGWKMAAYIGLVFYTTMALTGVIMDVAFAAFGIIPETNPKVHAEMVSFAINYTFWLNIVFGALAVGLVWLAAKGPRRTASKCCCGKGS